MRKQRTLLLSFVLLLALCISLLTPVSHAAADHVRLKQMASTAEVALDAAFSARAVELDTEASALEQENGEADEIALMRQYAAILRNFSFNSYELAIVEDLYEKEYIGTYRSVSDAADEMASILSEKFYLDKLEDETDCTTAVIYSYVYAVGDTYASYYDVKTYADFTSDSAATYSGIGVTVVQTDDGYVEVIAVTKDSPAEAAGMALGDIIIAVEGEDFAALGYTAAVNKIRGETGTPVTITIKRGETTIDLTMTRQTLTEYTVTYRMLEGEEAVGYIHISQFDEGTFLQFVEAVEDLEEQGAKKFVFDVRNNPGGRLEAVLGVLDYILPDDTDLPLIRLEYKNDEIEYDHVDDYIDGDKTYEKLYQKAAKHEIKAPITVLCNEYTASAGELFTSCLKDFGVAQIIGTQTYGKGTGQTGYRMSDVYAYWADGQYYVSSYSQAAMLNLSTFYYAPPVSPNYEGVGVTPHTVIDLPEEVQNINIYKLTLEQDVQLQAGLTYLASCPVIEDTEDPSFLSPALLWTLFGILSAIGLTLVAAIILFMRKNAKAAVSLTMFDDGDTSSTPKRSNNDNNTGD